MITKARDVNYFSMFKWNKDPCFWSHFHVDWYCSVAKSKKTLLVPMKHIN
jgi:hypothetical protein